MLSREYRKFITDKLKGHSVELSNKDLKDVFTVFESYINISSRRLHKDLTMTQIRAVAETAIFSVTNILNILHKGDGKEVLVGDVTTE